MSRTDCPAGMVALESIRARRAFAPPPIFLLGISAGQQNVKLVASLGLGTGDLDVVLNGHVPTVIMR